MWSLAVHSNGEMKPFKIYLVPASGGSCWKSTLMSSWFVHHQAVSQCWRILQLFQTQENNFLKLSKRFTHLADVNLSECAGDQSTQHMVIALLECFVTLTKSGRSEATLSHFCMVS